MKRILKVLCLALSLILSSSAFLACSPSGGEKISDPLKWEEAIKNTLQASSAYMIKHVGGKDRYNQYGPDSYYEFDSDNNRILNHNRNVTITVSKTLQNHVEGAKYKNVSTTVFRFKDDRAQLGDNYYGKVDDRYHLLEYNDDGNYSYYSKYNIYNPDYVLDMGSPHYAIDFDLSGYITHNFYTVQVAYLRDILGVIKYDWEYNADSELVKQVNFVAPEQFYYDFIDGKYQFNIQKEREHEKYIARETTYKYDSAKYDEWLKEKEDSWRKSDASVVINEESVVFRDSKIKEIHRHEKYTNGLEYKETIVYEYGKTKNIDLPKSEKIIDLFSPRH